MRHYLLSVFFNYIFFVLTGIIFHCYMVDGNIDSHIWLLLLIGGLYYSPIYIISNIPIIVIDKLSKNENVVYYLAICSTTLLSLSLTMVDMMDKNFWIVFVLAELLTCLLIYFVKHFRINSEL